MKSFAKFLTGITLVAVLCVGYYILSSQLPTAVKVRVVPARERAEDFLRAEKDVASGKYEGVEALDSIDRYYFVTMEAEARNYSLFSAEWAQLSIAPSEGDILVFSQDGGPKDVKPFGKDKLTLTVLTRSPSAQRRGVLEYYIFGRVHWLEVAPDKA